MSVDPIHQRPGDDEIDRLIAAFVEPPSSWMSDAACRGSDVSLFFPERGANTHATAGPRAVCARCPVADQCLEYAMADLTLKGIWGGKSHRERRALARRRAGLPPASYDPIRPGDTR